MNLNKGCIEIGVRTEGKIDHVWWTLTRVVLKSPEDLAAFEAARRWTLTRVVLKWYYIHVFDNVKFDEP